MIWPLYIRGVFTFPHISGAEGDVNDGSPFASEKGEVVANIINIDLCEKINSSSIWLHLFVPQAPMSIHVSADNHSLLLPCVVA